MKVNSYNIVYFCWQKKKKVLADISYTAFHKIKSHPYKGDSLKMTLEDGAKIEHNKSLVK